MVWSNSHKNKLCVFNALCVFVNFILVLLSYVLMLKIIGENIIDPS